MVFMYETYGTYSIATFITLSVPEYNLSLLCDQNIYAFLIPPICDICPIHPILLDALNSNM
jgi:hypothetical protein